MAVRCKFKCTSKTQHEAGYVVSFSAVTSGSKENEAFFKWTPNARLEIGTISETQTARVLDVRHHQRRRRGSVHTGARVLPGHHGRVAGRLKIALAQL